MHSFTDVIILAAVEWNFVVQAQHKLAREWAKQGLNVVYVEPILHRMPRLGDVRRILRRVMHALTRSRSPVGQALPVPLGVTVVSPLLLPESNSVFQYVNRMLLIPVLARRLKSSCRGEPAVEVWKPLRAFWDTLAQLDAAVSVYSCIDQYSQQRDAPPHYQQVEGALLGYCSGVITNSHILRERLESVRTPVRYRPPAVDVSHFKKAARRSPPRIERLVYHGVISGDRLDLDLMAEIARSGYEVNLVGPLRDPGRLLNDIPPGLVLHGMVAYADLPEVLAPFDAFLLAYRVTGVTDYIRPAKIYECFATGKPVFATHLPSLASFGSLIRLGSSSRELTQAIHDYDRLDADDREAARARRMQEAEGKSWPTVAEQELLWMRRGCRADDQ